MKDKVKNNSVELENFLNSAISDISGYVKFLDTKVSIIMAALGVVIAEVVNCRNIIISSYNIVKFSNIKYTVLVSIVVGFLVSVFYVYFWGIKTLMSHTCNIQYETVWFIKKENDELPFEKYIEDVKKMDSNDIVDTMSAELYKLNYINREKMRTINKTIKAFATSLILLFIGIIYLIIVNQ